MGNYMSCASPLLPSDNGVKIVSLDGSVKEFEKGIKVAEVMVEIPLHFLCDANLLQAGRRIEPLSADCDLQAKQVYAVLPMSKLHCALSSSEMVAITRACTSFKKPSTHHSSPPICHSDKLEEFLVRPKINLEEFQEAQSRLYRCTWRPKLETIREVHVRG